MHMCASLGVLVCVCVFSTVVCGPAKCVKVTSEVNASQLKMLYAQFKDHLFVSVYLFIFMCNLKIHILHVRLNIVKKI